MVTLPLATILPQLNPALITRRRAQKQVEVPEEVFSPFESQGDGLVFSVAEPEPVPQEPAVPTFRGPANVPAPMPSLRASIQSAATPQAPAAAPLVAPSLFTSARAARPTGSAPAPQPAPATAAAPAAPAPPKPAPEVARLLAGLSALAETWPDAVRQEIVQLNLVDAKVGLPVEAVERALKQGRIAFTWKMVRSWIKPAPPAAVSANDGALLELPLKVVAPLFLARQKEVNPPQQKISIDEQIPNLFFGFPQAEASAEEAAGSHAVAKPVDTNYYVWDDTSELARVDASEYKRRPTPGTSFINRYATPNEVISRAAALDGVAGALIALPDGLMVASQLSPDLNGETLAAFLPQIFGKVSQCTKELRMGELNNLNFTVGNVPWKIFRVNAIFFAAFGIEGEPLPTAQLAELAGELDRKQK
jgi:predicted regulator of Ras-like GTPase activity (Roadblock/LC7/MglB family)